MENENNQFPQEENPAETDMEETVSEEETVFEEEIVEEPAEQEMKKGILLTPGKLVGLIAGAVVLVAVLVGLIVYGMGGFGSKNPAEATDSTGETVVPTYAVDTGRDDVTYKGTYTASDDQVAAMADKVIATAGKSVMTVRDLQVYYWMQVQNFFYNYSYYLASFGLDYNQSLDTQICQVLGNGYTWQQYFLEAAFYNWHNDQALANAAMDNNVVVTGEPKEYMDTLAENLKNSAATQGFSSVEEMLAYNFGPCTSLESYIGYENSFILGNQYYTQQKDAIKITEDEVAAYFAEHEEDYTANGITKDGNFVDVRHILIVPEGKNPGDEYTEDEWATIETEAQSILDTYLAGEKTAESFGELANEHSADNNGNVTNGGLYENVEQGMMVPAFDAWCFDESRQAGDTDLVKTEYGYHVMYFVGRNPIWEVNAREDMLAEMAEKIVADACDAYPIEVDYSAIVLSDVNMAKWFGE